MSINYWGISKEEAKEISNKIKQSFSILVEKEKIIVNGILNWVEKNILESQLKEVRKKSIWQNQENNDTYFSEIEEYERYFRWEDDNDDDDDMYSYLLNSRHNDEDFIDTTNLDVDCCIALAKGACYNDPNNY